VDFLLRCAPFSSKARDSVRFAESTGPWIHSHGRQEIAADSFISRSHSSTRPLDLARAGAPPSPAIFCLRIRFLFPPALLILACARFRSNKSTRRLSAECVASGKVRPKCRCTCVRIRVSTVRLCAEWL
jgi:hypothetical protein